MIAEAKRIGLLPKQMAVPTAADVPSLRVGEERDYSAKARANKASRLDTSLLKDRMRIEREYGDYLERGKEMSPPVRRFLEQRGFVRASRLAEGKLARA